MTLNDYGMRRLSPSWLPQEYEYLKTNLEETMRRRDPEMVGEFLDFLRAFGMTEADPLIRIGVEYLLSIQNADGSWGGAGVYAVTNSTWTAVDRLRLYAWRGKRGPRRGPTWASAAVHGVQGDRPTVRAK